MKIKELKHNHTLTDLLKVILFSIVMLLPFFSVLTKSLYVICNKNAKDSYYGETINQTEVVNITNVNNLEIGKRYRFSNIGNIVSSTSTGSVSKNYMVYTDIELITPSSNGNLNNSLINSVKLGFYKLSGNTNLSYFVYDINNNDSSYSSGIGSFVIEFTLTNIVYNFNFLSMYESNVMQNFTYNEYSYLDNAFEYSIYQLENSNLYNWTKTTGTYTGINAMCNGIGVNMDVIPMILTYWFLMSVIYIVLDIVIKVITYLTHMIGSKSA